MEIEGLYKKQGQLMDAKFLEESIKNISELQRIILGKKHISGWVEALVSVVGELSDFTMEIADEALAFDVEGARALLKSLKVILK